jgi:hypothetical protein
MCYSLLCVCVSNSIKIVSSYFGSVNCFEQERSYLSFERGGGPPCEKGSSEAFYLKKHILVVSVNCYQCFRRVEPS